MNKIFKSIIFVLVAALSFSLFACGQNKPEDDITIDPNDAVVYFKGEFTGYFDYLGFNSGTKDTWVDSDLKWIRSIYSVVFNEDGTFIQTIYNAQRANYSVDVANSNFNNATRFNPRSQDSSKFTPKAFKDDGNDKEKAIRDYHTIPNMEGATNFGEKGYYYITNNNQIILTLKEKGETTYSTKIFATKVNDEWVINKYSAFISSMGENFINTTIEVEMSKVIAE